MGTLKAVGRTTPLTSGNVGPASFPWMFQGTSDKAIDVAWREKRSENEYERKHLETQHREHFVDWIERAATKYKKMSLPTILQELSEDRKSVV